ncbi:MAG: PepSY domain-containing protein [Roseibium sp.]|nr:PepSY domain-containing protein [Roseibium sp.]
MKDTIMLKKSLAVLCLCLAPVAAQAMPAVGDMVGTNPEEATAALAKAGCTVKEFEAEDGKIEAKCTDTQNKLWEVYIDPKSGKVTNVKNED